MASDDLDLSAILASRICHDIVGPVGAIGNGLELLAEEDDPEMRQQALDLLTHSAEQAARRLTFYRLAFGASGGANVPVSLIEARDAAARWLEGGRTALAWPDDAIQAEMNKPRLRLLLNLLLVAVDALPRGGEVAVAVAADAARLEVVAAGTGAGVDGDLAAALDGCVDAGELTPKQLPAYLATRLAAALGGQVEYAADGEKARFTASFS
ncbi:MAG: histidine phosphotransferase family protein [Alphaproteobacteria bacterium]